MTVCGLICKFMVQQDILDLTSENYEVEGKLVGPFLVNVRLQSAFKIMQGTHSSSFRYVFKPWSMPFRVDHHKQLSVEICMSLFLSNCQDNFYQMLYIYSYWLEYCLVSVSGKS